MHTVAYAAAIPFHPDDVSCVWLLNDGMFMEFTLAESRFLGLNLVEVDSFKASQKSREKSLRGDNLQAQIDLAGHIEAVANVSVRSGDTHIKQVRHTRTTEQRRTHIDFVKGGAKNG